MKDETGSSVPRVQIFSSSKRPRRFWTRLSPACSLFGSRFSRAQCRRRPHEFSKRRASLVQLYLPLSSSACSSFFFVGATESASPTSPPLPADSRSSFALLLSFHHMLRLRPSTRSATTGIRSLSIQSTPLAFNPRLTPSPSPKQPSSSLLSSSSLFARRTMSSSAVDNAASSPMEGVEAQGAKLIDGTLMAK